MHWFYVRNSQIIGSEIKITGEDVNHIKNVLRMKPGEAIIICNGQGEDFYCVIESLSEEKVMASIQERKDNTSELPANIYLFQGLPKNDKMEWIIQKAVELGAYEIIPVAMKRCVMKLDDKKKEYKKIERWQSIAVSAAKQSTRGRIPKVRPVMSFTQAVAYAEKIEYNVIPYELADEINRSHEIIKKSCEKNSIGVFIGPEGGFDEDEIVFAKKAGMEIITLGKRILRTETAGLTVLSILMFELDKRRPDGE